MEGIGASDGDVKSLFFAEAGAMGILGGIAAWRWAWAIDQLSNLGTTSYLKRPVFSSRTFLVGAWWLVGFAIFVFFSR